MEEQPSEDKKNDSKYRRYVAALEKCLQSFETVNEWADVISFLSRLGKVFNSFPSFKEIPFKLNLAKRLAQCLNPALPAGVHQKTLEIYEIVFRKIGHEGLIKDLSLYSFGLFPFFEHSATLVKNSLLELYEVYLVPLGPGLTPSLRPLVLSIILGLEEESSDYFIKVNNLLNRVKSAVGTYEFFDAIWTGLLISPHHRLAIINFLLKNIPTNASNQELLEICVNNTKLVSAAFASSLQDQGQLVIRGSLEILLKHFPVEKRFFETQQLVDLFQASINVLTRKDMSLTRRFYTWILTPGSAETETLSEYNLKILIMAMKNIINNQFKTPDGFSKPFKLLVFILDKPLVSDPVLKECLFSLLNILVEASSSFLEPEFSKILNSANLLFRMIELDTIWSTFIREIAATDFNDYETVKEKVKVIDFAINNVCIYDESSTMIQVIRDFTDLCVKMFLRVQIQSSNISEEVHRPDIEESVRLFCQNLIDGIGSRIPNTGEIYFLMIANAKVITDLSNRFDDLDSETNLKIEAFSKVNGLLLLLMESFCMNGKLDFGFDLWLQKLMNTLESNRNIDIIQACLNQVKKFSSFWLAKSGQVRSVVIGKTLPLLWNKFSESSDLKRHHLCTLIAAICRMFPNESDIYFATMLSSAIRGNKFETIEHFTSFWDFSVSSQLLENVPLRISILILADSMTRDDFKFRKCSTSWIFTISKYLDCFLAPSLSSLIDILECGLTEASNSTLPKRVFRKQFDKGPIIYYFKIIERLLAVNYDATYNFLLITEVDSYLLIQMFTFVDLIKNYLNIDFELHYRNNYINLLIILCLPLVAMEESKLSKIGPASARVAAFNMICALSKGENSGSLSLIRVLLDLSIHKLNHFVRNMFDIEKQAQFLNLLNCLFSNALIAPLLSSHDIIHLTEINKKAIEMADNSEIIHNWSEFALNLGHLPNSNIEIIMSVLNDALVLRLQLAFENNSRISPGLLSSIFLCIAKLSIFYLAAKSNFYSDSNQLRKYVSCLLNEAKTENNSALVTMKLSTNINFEDFEKILLGLYSAHNWLFDTSREIESSEWSQCRSILRDSCNMLYFSNRFLITEVLLSIFVHQHTFDSEFNFHAFLIMFYDQDASEYIKTTVSMLKTSKETWKNHEILLKFILQFGKYESDETIILEVWNILLGQIKDISSSGFKYKSIIWLLLETCCTLMDKLESFEPNRISKDFESILKLIEHGVIYASKLNDPSQWTGKTDERLDICSDEFTNKLLENVKDRNVGKCINSICRTLVPSAARYFRENDKLNAVMTPIIINLITPNFKSALRYSLMGQISAYFLGQILKMNSVSTKFWKRDLWESFCDNSYLWLPRYYFTVLSEAFRVIMQEPERFPEILNKFSTSATASMFLSKDAEILSKAMNIRRLSFLTFWSNHGSFRVHLPSLQEKLVDLTKFYNGFILGEIFFLIRVFLLRMDDESISSLWPLIITELVQSLENYIKTDQNNYSDLFAVFQACKLIDIMLTLRTSSILLYHWLFFDADGKDGLFLRLEHKIKIFNKIESKSNLIQPVKNLKRRPLLSCSSAKDSTILLPFLETARSHLSHDFIMIQNLDRDFIDTMTENDLLEFLEIK